MTGQSNMADLGVETGYGGHPAIAGEGRMPEVVSNDSEINYEAII